VICLTHNLTDRQTDRQTDRRKSGIELLKIFGIILIVISHVVQTVESQNTLISYQDYVIPLSNATENVQLLIMSILRYSGALGNTIFFVCSAWFLVGREKKGTQKAFSLLIDIWIISVIYFAIVFCLRQGDLPIKMIIKQFLPTTFANNWYMTCYIIFLLAYPLLNIVINAVSQKQLLRIVAVTSFLWIISDFIKGDLFFPSSIILWCTIYFIIAYVKIYMPGFQNNTKINLILLVVGVIGYIGEVLVTNALGLHISFFAEKLLRWNTNCNPFGIIFSIGALNLFRRMNFKSSLINYISSLSMLIYLIHENILFRTYYRPAIWQWIYINLGYDKILLYTSIYVILLFIIAAVISAVYKETIQKFVYRLSNCMYNAFSKIWQTIEKVVLNIK